MTKTIAKIGHNSGDAEPQDVGGVAGKRLLSFLERIETLESEKSNLVEDIKEIFIEVKSAGLCVKTVRKIVKLRKMELEKRREQDELLTLYMQAIQMEMF